MGVSLDQLPRCADERSLQQALQTLCTRYGTVAHLQVWRADQAGHHQALCLWRMASADEELQLMRELGVGRFGGELVMVVDLDWPAPCAAASGVTGVTGATVPSGLSH